MNKQISKEEKIILKAKGIMPQKQEEYFSIKALSNIGYFKTKEIIALTNIADKYGNGTLGVTSRTSIEVQYISYNYVEAVLEEVKNSGLSITDKGLNLKSISACKGSICNNGLIDTNNLALKIKERFKEVNLTNKFKIGVFGCPNGYGRAQSNDIGIVAQKKVTILEGKCLGCSKCIDVCRSRALNIKDNKVILDNKRCVSCGKCAEVCQANAIGTNHIEILIFIGGRLGRKARLATPINKIFSEDEVISTVNHIIKYYINNAKKRERLAELIERVGIKKVEEEILGIK